MINETQNKLRALYGSWFTEGIYNSNWYYYPKIKNLHKIVKEPDLIYISHIHTDYHDPKFL